MENVGTVLVDGGKLDLPGKSLDLVFMRNVCHHLDRVDYFRRLRCFLKPDGRVAIIDGVSHQLYTAFLDIMFLGKLLWEDGGSGVYGKARA